MVPFRLVLALVAAAALSAACDDPDAAPDGPVVDNGPPTPADALPEPPPPDAESAADAQPDSAPDAAPPPCGPMLHHDPDGAHWLDAPWPSDTRLRDGHPDLDQTPLPDNLLVAPYLDIAATVDGFGLNGAAYVRFDGLLDAGALPTPAETLAPDSPVQLVVHSGPERGRRLALEVGLPAVDDDWVDRRTLMARPVPGFVLPAGAVVCVAYTAGLIGVDGCPAGPAPGFVDALQTDATLAPLAADGPADLIGGTCYTTRSIGGLDAAVQHARAEPAPTVRIVSEELRGGPARRILRVEYDAPIYQSGEAPWRAPGSGRLMVDADGRPVARRVHTAAILVVPDVEPPAGGFPVVQYASGTGGPMTVCPSIARQAYGSGHAVICVDRPGLGERGDGTEPPWPDFRNPFASLGLMAQEVVDHLTLTRVVAAIAAGEVEPVPDGPAVPSLDAGRPALLGFSQGALMAGIAAGVLPELDAVIIDSGGGLAIEGALARPDSADLVALFAPLLGMAPENLDGLHPAVATLQLLADAVDPINYAGRWLGPGMPDVLVLSGTRDTKTLTAFANALATAAGVPVAAPVLEPGPGHALLGLEPSMLPIRGNLDGRTGVLIQIDGDHGLRRELGETMDHWLRTRLEGAAEAR